MPVTSAQRDQSGVTCSLVLSGRRVQRVKESILGALTALTAISVILEAHLRRPAPLVSTVRKETSCSVTQGLERLRQAKPPVLLVRTMQCVISGSTEMQAAPIHVQLISIMME